MRATTENSKRESAHGYPGAIGTSLCQYSAGLDGHLFTTVNGRLLDQRNVLDGLHGAGKRGGFHVFRRFRFCCAPKGWCAGPLNQAVDGPTRLADRYAGTLSYGDQRRLEIARALAAEPRFLLLDEPAAGMNEAESAELGGAVQAIRKEHGCGVLVVEHDLRLIMRICDHVVVLNEGEVIASGSPAEVRTDPAVVAAYIGTDDTGNATNGGAE